MSRTHVKKFVAEEKARQSTAERILAEHITDILVGCGVFESPEQLLDEIKRSFSEALHEIVRLALEFQRITGEHVVSRDLVAVVVPVGVAFDSGHMVDEWADPRKSSRDLEARSVLCTTQLGVIREESRSKEDSELEISSTVLLKPKVVLTSMLEELWNEHAGAGTPRVG